MNQTEVNRIVDSGHMIFCFDIDGTLNKFTDNDLTKVKPRTEVVKLLRERFNRNDTICLYTGRPKSEKQKTEKWLKDNDIPYHEIAFDKPKAHIYIDDSTIDFRAYIKDADKYDTIAKKSGNKINKLVRKDNGEK